MATFALAEKAILLNPADDVMIAKANIPAGTIIEDDGRRIEVRQDIRAGHKVALRPARVGEPIRRYGQIIGFATAEIDVGDHVHVHNLAVGELQQKYEIGVDVKPVDYYPPESMRSFDGFKRADGRVGTRNRGAGRCCSARTTGRSSGCWPATRSIRTSPPTSSSASAAR